MPTSTNLLLAKLERIRRVYPTRPALAVLAIQFPNRRSSLFRLYKEDDAARSRSSRTPGTRARQGAHCANRGRAHLAAALPYLWALLVSTRAASGGRAQHMYAARAVDRFLRRGQAGYRAYRR